MKSVPPHFHTHHCPLLRLSEMNNRVIKACFAAGCSVAVPVLAFSASGFGVKALGSSDGVSSSRFARTATNFYCWMFDRIHAEYLYE